MGETRVSEALQGFLVECAHFGNSVAEPASIIPTCAATRWTPFNVSGAFAMLTGRPVQIFPFGDADAGYLRASDGGSGVDSSGTGPPSRFCEDYSPWSSSPVH